jgi:hypothetical protein
MVFSRFTNLDIYAGTYMYISGNDGGAGETGFLTSPPAEEEQTVCLMFYYRLNGTGFKTLSVISQDTEFQDTLIWQLSSENGYWDIGEVQVTKAKRIIFEATCSSVCSPGYIVVDEILVEPHLDECRTVPAEAAPSPATTTSASPGGTWPECDFETDQCGWNAAVELNDTRWFHFVRTNGLQHEAGILAPRTDHNNNNKGKESNFSILPPTPSLLHVGKCSPRATRHRYRVH